MEVLNDHEALEALNMTLQRLKGGSSGSMKSSCSTSENGSATAESPLETNCIAREGVFNMWTLDSVGTLPSEGSFIMESESFTRRSNSSPDGPRGNISPLLHAVQRCSSSPTRRTASADQSTTEIVESAKASFIRGSAASDNEFSRASSLGTGLKLRASQRLSSDLEVTR